MEDIIIVTILLILIIATVCWLYKIKNRKKKYIMMETQSKKDMIDLEAITKNIEETYKPVTIKLTDYEQEQEDKAIISYEELVKNGHNEVSYESEYTTDSSVEVKKIDIDNLIHNEDHNRIGVTLMSYEAEESFLKALKQLQANLIR